MKKNLSVQSYQHWFRNYYSVLVFGIQNMQFGVRNYCFGHETDVVESEITISNSKQLFGTPTRPSRKQSQRIRIQSGCFGV